MKIACLFSVICFSTLVALAAAPSAEQVLAEAKSKAASENKAIFVHFSASWCPWCQRLEAWLVQPDIKAVFEKHFVQAKLVIRERGEAQKLENAGAGDVLKRWGGEGAGIPFLVLLDRKGDLIVSSMRPAPGDRKVNIAFPNDPEAVEWFVGMIQKAAPAVSADDLKLIEASLKSARTKA